ncbi:MAG: glycoside hydrolase family 5 protein [Chitinispirillaceae bacterium]|nr:glycoside hydrolase family 5 protein [Chitinispirillaceae bacterium]
MRRFLCYCLLLPVLLRAQPETIAPDQSDMSSHPAATFVKGMRVGWNVGNSLEAVDNGSGSYIPNETAWGNPKITQQLIDSVKAAGFNAIRLPVAWSLFSDASTWTIRKERLDRAEEVVNYALKRDLYVIMNEHWDGGWLQPTNAAKDTATKRLAAIWKQVAIRFRDYGDHLVFAGTNEVMKDGDYGTPTSEYVSVQNGYNQSFVNAVRATGGRNAFRYLVVQAFNTNIDHAISFFKMPSDQTKDRLILEVHFYDPWEFTIDGNNTTVTQWGANGNPSKKVSWDSDESHIDAQFAKMKNSFLNKGIPVILGEYAAMLKNTSDNPPFRLAWDKYVTDAAVKAGMIPFYWDPGFLSTNSSGLFERSTGKQEFPEVIAAIVEASPPVSARSREQKTLPMHSAHPGTTMMSDQSSGTSTYSLSGRLMWRSLVKSPSQPLSLSDLRTGVYITSTGSGSMSTFVHRAHSIQ